MKALFILLFTVSLFAQSPKPEYYLHPFLKLIFEYADSCYADSTEHDFEIYIFGTDTAYAFPTKYSQIDPYINPNYRGLFKKWIHRKPTFEGFIEFLRRRWK